MTGPAAPAPLSPAAPIGATEQEKLFDGLQAASPLLLAVSGGPDSVAMLGLAAEWAETAFPAPGLAVATVDHGLRRDAAAEAKLVAAFCATFGAPHVILPWRGAKPATGLQEAARAARYTLLADHARSIGATRILVAHSLDDQAETLLIRLCAGSGVAGLAGMRRETETAGIVLVRPLLDVGRDRLRATCIDRGWPFVDDPSNTDPRFARVRFRRIMPVLAKEGLTAPRLSALARRWAEAEEALAGPTAEAVAKATTEDGRLDLAHLGAHPRAIAIRALGQWLASRHLALGLPGQPLRLERVERLAAALLHARTRAEPLGRTIGGLRLTLDAGGVLVAAPAPLRRRGVRKI